jgi:hypothetical protein
MQGSRKFQRLGWLLLIWVASVASMAGIAGALKLVMRSIGLSG